jgi:hypothetical protein
VLFVIGKKNCDGVEPGQPNCGSSFYEIINRDASAVTAVMKWRMLGGSIDQDVTHALYLGPHTNLVAQDAEDLGLGTLVYCNDGVIARVKKLKESESEVLDDWYDFYGNAGTGGEGDIFWKSIGSDPETHIAFETGTQSEYEAAAKVDEHIYVTTEENRVDRMYKGEKLLGDAYVSGEDASATVANGIGGIQAGTTLQTILDATKGSISKVIDMMLFPAYAPQYAGPSGSITTPSQSSQYIYIYDLLPIAATSGNKAYTYVGPNKVYGGGINTVTVTRTYPDGTTDDGSTLLTATAIGTYRYDATFKFDPGTDLIKDSKGNNANGWASNATTPASASNLSTQHLKAVTGGYVVGVRSGINASPKSYTTTYPIWIGQPGSQTPSLQSANDSYTILNGGKAGIQLNSSMGRSATTTNETNSWYIDIPAGKTLKVILRGLDGTYPDANAQQIKLLPFIGTRYGVWTCSGGTDVQIPVDRYVYNGAAYSGGLHKIIVS